MSIQSLINQRIRKNSKLILEAKKNSSKAYNNLILLAEELEFGQDISDINPITEVDLIHNIVHNISDSEILIPDDVKDQFQISYDSLGEIEDPDVRKQVEAEILGESAESELYSKKVKWIADNIHKICDHPNYDTFVFDGQMLICYDKDKSDLMTMKDEMIKYPSNLIGNRNSSLFEAKDQDIEIDFDGKDVSYVDNIHNIEFTGQMKKYNSGRSDEFEPDWFADSESEKFWDENWEDLSKLIEDRYANRNIKESANNMDLNIGDTIIFRKKEMEVRNIDNKSITLAIKGAKNASLSLTLDKFKNEYGNVNQSQDLHGWIDSLDKDQKDQLKKDIDSETNSELFQQFKKISDQYNPVGMNESVNLSEFFKPYKDIIEAALKNPKKKMNQSTAYGEWSDKEIVNAYKDLIAAGHSKTEAITTISIDAIHDGPDHLDEEAIEEILKLEGVFESKLDRSEWYYIVSKNDHDTSWTDRIDYSKEEAEYEAKRIVNKWKSNGDKRLTETGGLEVIPYKTLNQSSENYRSFRHTKNTNKNVSNSYRLYIIESILEPIIEMHKCKLVDISLIFTDSDKDVFDIKISGSDNNIKKLLKTVPELKEIDQINESSYTSILQTESRNITPDSFEKAASDSYGNPRYVIGWWKVGSSYEGALNAMKEFGGKKFHNKQFGGGIIFNVQEEGLSKLCKSINKKINKVTEAKINSNNLTIEEFFDRLGAIEKEALFGNQSIKFNNLSTEKIDRLTTYAKKKGINIIKYNLDESFQTWEKVILVPKGSVNNAIKILDKEMDNYFEIAAGRFFRFTDPKIVDKASDILKKFGVAGSVDEIDTSELKQIIQEFKLNQSNPPFNTHSSSSIIDWMENENIELDDRDIKEIKNMAKPNDSFSTMEAKNLIYQYGGDELANQFFKEYDPQKLNQSNSIFTLKDLENHIYKNIPEITKNIKSYGFDNISDIDNYVDLASLLGIDSRLLKDIDLEEYVKTTDDIWNMNQSMNESKKEDFIWTYSKDAESFMKTAIYDIDVDNASLKEICKAIDVAYDDNGWKVRKSEEIGDIEVFEMIPPNGDESEMEYGFKGAKTKKDCEKAFKKSSFSK
jgi:hypothetical protein